MRQVFLLVGDDGVTPMPGLSPTVMLSSGGDPFQLALNTPVEVGRGFYYVDIDPVENPPGPFILVASAPGTLEWRDIITIPPDADNLAYRAIGAVVDGLDALRNNIAGLIPPPVDPPPVDPPPVDPPPVDPPPVDPPPVDPPPVEPPPVEPPPVDPPPVEPDYTGNMLREQWSLSAPSSTVAREVVPHGFVLQIAAHAGGVIQVYQSGLVIDAGEYELAFDSSHPVDVATILHTSPYTVLGVNDAAAGSPYQKTVTLAQCANGRLRFMFGPYVTVDETVTVSNIRLRRL